LEVSTKNASFPGSSFKFIEGVSRNPLPLNQTFENFLRLWGTPFTEAKTLFVLLIKTLAIFLCAELGLRGFVV